ncbi:hypothetical protein NA56DRAFT_749389 [Hyaloscypha hepaticicola]|uniref:Uncharacterized protein n=1 Tax=Hyaloscypha hepaticicola TaxID=2082293 RepID=A0A2J6Q405_9HELO|nr:hypothetical protein NA56DRAFT_749389 [Hyaloscypha hepaticicola]
MRKMASATATHKQVSFSVPYRTVSWLESGIIQVFQDETGDCGLRVEWVLTKQNLIFSWRLRRRGLSRRMALVYPWRWVPDGSGTPCAGHSWATAWVGPPGTRSQWVSLAATNAPAGPFSSLEARAGSSQSYPCWTCSRLLFHAAIHIPPNEPHPPTPCLAPP